MIVFQLVLLYACIAYKPALPMSAESAVEGVPKLACPPLNLLNTAHSVNKAALD